MRMKRVVSILAVAVLVFGLTGCNAITIDGETENVSGEAAGNGSIGFSISTLNNPFFVTLSEGAKEKAKTEGEKLIVVDAGDDAAKQTANFNRSEGMSVMENMLQANSAIQGVFAHNDEMALGAVEAVGNKKILVVGFDATDDAVAAVKAGKMAATVAQKPNLMGETAVETAIQILRGETVEKTIPVEVELITKESVK